MIPGVRTAGVVACLAVLAFPVRAADDPRPGDRGKVLTAIEGTRIEEIPVTYLGRQTDATGPGYDLHLVRLDGPTAERVGVAAGMSGSPVYFGDRLIGALSYRIGALPVEPVAGVTPIEDVRRAASGATAASGAPIATPVQVAGLSGVVRDWVAPQLEALGLQLVAGNGGAAPGTVSTDLRPGSPVGVALIRGDLPVAATGTVTLVEGDRVYAFGHPLLGVGRVELPMVSAEVIHTVADRAGSFKLARIGDPVGTLVDDRLTAIVGTRGTTARMVPLALRVRSVAGGLETMRFEIATSPSLTPLLTGLAVANALVGSVGYESDTTAILSGRLKIRGYSDVPVEIAAASSSRGDPAVAAAARLQTIVSALWRNPFTEVRIDAIELDVSLASDVRSYDVEGLHFDRSGVRPGAKVPVTFDLRQYRGETDARSVELTVPLDVSPSARLAIAVGPPDYIDQLLGQSVTRRLRASRDLGTAIDALRDLGPAHRLQVVLVDRAPGLLARGRAYGPLPPTAEKLIGGVPIAGAGGSVLARAELVLDGPVDNGMVAPVEIEPRSSGSR